MQTAKKREMMVWKLVCILTILVLAAVITGCSPPTRHKVLSFFFTGVPPLEDKTEVEKKNPEKAPLPAPANRQVEIAEQIFYSHPVWAAGVCDPCHTTSSDFSIPGIKNKSVAVFKTGGGMVGKLVLHKNEICTQCHKDKTPLRALSEDIWLHNTTAKGDCLACHDPHQSRNQKTLRQPPAKLCNTSCHQKGLFALTPVHQTKDTCLSCHNPHMGKDKNLLTKEYQEIKIAVKEIYGHPELAR